MDNGIIFELNHLARKIKKLDKYNISTYCNTALGYYQIDIYFHGNSKSDKIECYKSYFYNNTTNEEDIDKMMEELTNISLGLEV